MNKILPLILLILGSSLTTIAQEKSVQAGEATSTFVGGTYLGTFQPTGSDVDLMPEYQLVKNEVNKSSIEPQLIKYKDSLTKMKIAAGVVIDQSSNKTTAEVIKPTQTSGFSALLNTGTPSDNTIAVGNDGKIIAAVNSSLRVYNSNGSGARPVQSFPVFWNPVTNKTNMCDPLVHYDANVDRYIIFTQVCDRGTADNRFLMAFSTTNDPGGSYHYYSFRANLREIKGSLNYFYDVWFDYPKMAVSENDVFVTGNLFRNQGSESFFEESAIWQIDKKACFAGSSNPNALVFDNLPGNPFTIVPAGDGLGGHYGDQMHLAMTVNGLSSNSIRMYTIDGNVNNSPSLSTSTVSTPSYSQPADGVQLGTNVVLNSGDMRGMSAMYVNGTVHFVYHSNGPGGYIAINYNRLTRSGNSWALQNKLISFAGVDCGFPSVASMSHTQYEQAALIVFDYSSLSDYPGYRAVFVDHDMKISPFEQLRQGDAPITTNADNQGRTRWGDYSGIARKHNESIPTVWGFGMYANSVNRWSNHISEIKTSAWVVGTDDINKKNQSVAVFPNPVIDKWSLRLDVANAGKLEVIVYDLTGKKVKDVFTANVSVGQSEFSFNKNGLANGTYIVKVFIDQKNIADEKIIVTK